MKTSNDLMAYIDGFKKDDIIGNNVLLVPFVKNGLLLYVFNNLSKQMKLLKNWPYCKEGITLTLML